MQLRPFAVAAIVMTAAAPAALAQEAVVPHVVALTPQDEAAYREAFNAIDAGDWRGVTSALGRVDDDFLVPTVRGRLLASSGYRASYSDLTSFLNRYEDLGVSGAVYQRALAVRPHRGRGRRRRPTGPAPNAPAEIGVRVLPGTAAQPPGDSASARVAIARIADLVGEGDDEAARNLALSQIGGAREGQAQWQLGLIAYRHHDYAEAIRQFEASAQWPYHGGWATSAVRYWAARARLAAGETNGVVLHLETAAARPWTFYGQLAEAQLGRESGLDFTPPILTEEELRPFLERYPGARRAAALGQLGRVAEVEAEMRRLHGSLPPSDDRVFLALATSLRAPAAQLRAAEFGGLDLASGFCPATNFAPDSGFTLDRALVYAIVRQESYYNPRAVSVSNARGLMQLLPSTARDMDTSTNYRRQPALLFEPGLNMRLGQNYVQWLMDEFHNDGDLGRVFAAYNGGPGWLSRWLATGVDASDPLMVLEMLPRAESRDYAERVLSHMALCRKSFGQPTPELDRLASGEAAHYEPLDARVASSAP